MRINIDDAFFSDSRFEFLAEALQEHVFMAQGRIQRIWLECYRRRSATLAEDLIVIQARWAREPSLLIEGLIRAKLATRVDGGLRLAGVEARVQYLINAVKFGSAGGRKAAEMAHEAKSDIGRVPSADVGRVPSSDPQGSGESPSRVLDLHTPSPSPALSPVPSHTQPPPEQSARMRVDPRLDSAAAAAPVVVAWDPLPDDLTAIWIQERKGRMRDVQPRVSPTTDRWKLALNALKEQPDLNAWRAHFKRLAASQFGRGETDTSRGFTPTFEWAIKPDTVVKCAEGAYDDETKAGAGDATTRWLQSLRDGTAKKEGAS